MLKQTIQYTNFDDVTVSTDLYFNIGKTDFLLNQGLRQELSELSEEMQSLLTQLGGVERELVEEEKQFMIDLVVKFIKLSYGERSSDGEQFNKIGAFERFQQQAAFEGFILWLFQDTDRAMSFMIGVMPKDIRDSIGDKDQLELPVAPSLAAVPDEDMDEEDFAKLLAEADSIPDPNAGKKAISQAQADHMQGRLNGKQFAQFMSKHYVKVD